MELLSEYCTYAIPVNEIWVDPDFNCRERFLPESVKTLADDIQTSGLTYPLLVQPWDKESSFNFRLIAGFRRYAACRMLKMLKVPAMITEKDITEFEAHKLNLLENLERKDLNILEEARGIEKLFPNGATARDIACELNKTARWVHRRLGVLDLPHDVQLMFASGRLLQGDLDVLMPMRNDSDALKSAAHAILDARLESPAKAKKVRLRYQKGRAVTDTRKTKEMISKMISKMFELGIRGLPTRVAAWCAGGVSDAELLADLMQYASRYRPGKSKSRKKSTKSVKTAEKVSDD